MENKTNNSKEQDGGKTSKEHKFFDWDKIPADLRKKLKDNGFPEGEKVAIEEDPDTGDFLIFKVDNKGEKELFLREDKKTKNIEKVNEAKEGKDLMNFSFSNELREKYLNSKQGEDRDKAEKDLKYYEKKASERLERDNPTTQAGRKRSLLKYFSKSVRDAGIRGLMQEYLSQIEKENREVFERFESEHGGLTGKTFYNEDGKWMRVTGYDPAKDEINIIFGEAKDASGKRKSKKDRHKSIEDLEVYLKEYTLDDPPVKAGEGEENKKAGIGNEIQGEAKGMTKGEFEEEMEKRFGGLHGITLRFKDKQDEYFNITGNGDPFGEGYLYLTKWDKNEPSRIETGTIEGYEDRKGLLEILDRIETVPDEEVIDPKPENKTKTDQEEPKEKAPDEELLKLQDAVARARAEYAKKDYEVNNVFAQLRRSKIGKFMSSKPSDLHETHNLHNAYKKALTELLNFEKNRLKESNLPPEELNAEMERLAKYFDQDEKINLYEAHTDARAAAVEKKWGKTPGKIMEWGGKMINGYRKMRIDKKVALSVAATVTGLGVGQRILSGAATGAAVTAGLEAYYRNRESKKTEKERAGIMNKMEGTADQEEMLKLLMAHAEEKISGYDKDLRREIKNSRIRIGVGAAAGLTAAFGVPALMKCFGHHLPADMKLTASHASTAGGNLKEAAKSTIGAAKEHVAKKAAEDVVGGVSGETVKETVSSQVHEHAAKQAVEHASNLTGLTGIQEAVKGDSIWKMIGEHIKDNHDFSSLSPERQTYVIDALKDRVANHHAEFGLKNIDKIKVHYKLDFSKLIHGQDDFKSIVDHAKNLTKAQIDNIHNNNATILHWVQTHHGEALTSPKVEEILHSAHEHTGKAVHTSKEGVNQIVERMKEHGYQAPKVAPNQPIASQWPKANISRNGMASTDFSSFGKPIAEGFAAGAAVGGAGFAVGHNREKIADFAKEKAARAKGKIEASQRAKTVEKLNKKYSFIPGEESSGRGMKIIQAISFGNNENWRLMKVVKLNEKKYKETLTKKLSKNVEELEEFMIGRLGKTETKLKNKNETLQSWLARMLKKIEAQEKETSQNSQKAA